MKHLILVGLLLVSSVCAEVIPIQPLETCMSCSAEPSLTFYRKGKDSKALVIFIPGGWGYIGLKQFQNLNPQPAEIGKSSFSQGLNSLSNPELTSGKLDVVLLDSPSELSPGQRWPAARTGFDHMIRIESAIKYYKEKTGLPVWVMGHSNGGISLTEFFKYAKKNNKTDLISGFIASGVRSETYFEAPITFPILFIHHEKDGCSDTVPKASFANYEKVKAASKFPTEFVYVTGGSAESTNPCISGTHMYNEANQEFAKYIENFVLKNSP